MLRITNRNGWVALRALLVSIPLIGLLGTGLEGQAVSPGLSERGPRFLRMSDIQGSATLVSQETAALLGRRITLHAEDAKLADVLHAISVQSGIHLVFSPDVVPVNRSLSLDVSNSTVEDVLKEALNDAGVDVVVSGTQVALIRSEPPPSAAPEAEPATITGQVTETNTGAGLAASDVMLEGTRFRTVSNQTGHYLLVGVPPGSYTLVARRPGYAEARVPVSLTDGESAVVDIGLEIAAVPLDEIVVTGTVGEVRRRTVPNPITVLSTSLIDMKQASDLPELIRGEIPGLLPLSSGKDDRSPEIFIRGNAGWSAADYVKVYIDGVQVANVTAITTIDPKSIERIEVVRGPQASVIYGSEAASGVLQIFTKKGAPTGVDRPQLDVQVSTGFIESDHTPSHLGVPILQDHALNLSGGSDVFSYRAGISYGNEGEWVKGFKNESLGMSGAFRAAQGPVSAEVSVLWSSRENMAGANPIFLRYEKTEMCPQCGDPDYADNMIHRMGQNTIGLTLTYQAMARWRHNLVFGLDHGRSLSYEPEPANLFPGDTLVDLMQQETERRSIRYNTTFDADLFEGITGRFTLGGDYWYYDAVGSTSYDLIRAFPNVVVSDITYSSFQNNKWWNAGYFGLAEVGIHDKLFLTMAARVEEMRNLGEDYGRPVQPRIGASYVRPIGGLEAKFRAQWGKGVRMPPSHARTGSTSAFSIYLPNPDLGPEEKKGWDAGVELYWGDRGSIEVTRYDEVGTNLIQVVNIDMASTPPVYQYQNIGEVGSKGWEVQASANLGRFMVKANYAYADNRIQALSNSYLDSPWQTFKVGDRRAYIPKHSGGGTVTARIWRGIATLNASMMKDWRAVDAIAQHDVWYGGAPPRDDYYITYPSLWRFNFRSEQRLTPRLSAFLRIDNLTDNQGTDYENYSVSRGRTTVVGARISTN